MPVRAGQPAEGNVTPGGRVEDGAQVVQRQRSPVVPAVQLHVAAGQVRQRVVAGAPVLNHPGEEALDGVEVQVARLDAAAARAQGVQRFGRRPRVAPGLAVAGRFQPVTAHQRRDGGRLDPQQRGEFLPCKLRLLPVEGRDGAALFAQVGEVLLGAGGG